jgi:hypothetical protein
MKPDSPVILLEFNELSPAVMERFIREGKLPNFKTLYDESLVYITAAVERRPYLEPWIQWVNVHTGLNYAEHGIFFLGDGHKLKEKYVWDRLSDAGFRVWVCGSMNVRYDSPINGWVLPDPWTFNLAPYPETLTPYFRFVQCNVQEHTKDRVPLAKSDYVKFMAFMMSHGLSSSSVASITKQLVSERRGRNRWKRAAILDKLQFDLFSFVYRKLKPHFSTFFVNSTAHLQHMYWRNLEPELFRVKPTPQEQEEFESAILFGYQEMDLLIGRFRELVGDDATIILCTALSQQPCLIYEDLGGKVCYRPRDFEELIAFAGITTRHTVTPVMAEEFHICFESEKHAADARPLLLGLQVGRRPLLCAHRDGKVLYVGCQVNDDLPQDSVLQNVHSGQSAPFFDLIYRFKEKKSGMHHPDGMLWIRRPEKHHHVHVDKVALTSIAPTILDMFGILRPDSMRAEPLRFDERESRAAAATLG